MQYILQSGFLELLEHELFKSHWDTSNSCLYGNQHEAFMVRLSLQKEFKKNIFPSFFIL